MKHKKKQYINEGRAVGGGPFQYGGFPRVIKEEQENLSTVGVREMYKILKSGGHPVMSGQTVGGKRGVPDEVRQKALEHLETIMKHAKGPTPNYNKEHPIFKEAKAAHEFFSQNFPEFGVEEEIAANYDLNDLD